MIKYKVGGAVRDTIMGIQPRDVDWVIVGATAKDIQNLLEQKFEPVGKDFPIFLHPETGEEYALARTARQNGAGSNSHITIEEDLSHRDLTINAMAMDEQGNIIDPYGGVADIQAGILRHVSPSFAEDPLRVIRLAKFVAKLDFKVHPDTMHFIKETVIQKLNTACHTRVWLEVFKLLDQTNYHKGIQFLNEAGASKMLWGTDLNTQKPQADWKMTEKFVQVFTSVNKTALQNMKLPSEFLEALKDLKLIQDAPWNTESVLNTVLKLRLLQRPNRLQAIENHIPKQKVITLLNIIQAIKLEVNPEDIMKRTSNPKAIIQEQQKVVQKFIT